MNLLSHEKNKNPLSIYGYVITGGFGSLLMLFLIQKSLPLNNQKARQYQQDIQIAQRKVLGLEKKLLATKPHSIEIEGSLKSQIDAIDTAIDTLKDIPSFISASKQSILRSKLETQEILLGSHLESIDRLQNARVTFERACLRVSKLKQEIIKNPQALGNNISTESVLLISVIDLLETSIQYCRNTANSLESALQEDVEKINLLLEREQFGNSKFIVTEFISYSQEIIEQSKIIDSVSQQIEFEPIVERLREIEVNYQDNYYEQLQEISTYRLITSLWFLLITISIAYKINSNLSKTNRNIVKILEGFTKELESKVEERTAQLEDSIQNTEAALTQAQNANQAKSRFLANMSHELRTPLNAILGFTQLMTRDSSIGEEQQENLKIINRSGEHLLRLINDILEMSKIEVGQITLNESQFDLHLMLKSIEEMLRLKAQAKNLNLSFNIAKNVPRIIYTDEGKLRQITINLLGNALKFTEAGSVTLNVEVDRSARPAADKIDFLFSDTYALKFSVEDTGPGIEPEEMERLFTPFEQTKIGRISNEGTGLGLSICHKFVDLMGGELKVESTVNRGSIFSFDILLRVQNISAAEIAPQTGVLGQRIIGLTSDREYRILAVDDVPASRLLLSKLLTAVGFSVREAGNGREAIDIWQEWYPDLILMDMRMPIVDGYKATKEIKSLPQGKATIIIALTASAFEEERVEVLSAGCDDFMRKPFQEAELLEKIGQYLNLEYIYEPFTNKSANEQMLSAELSARSLAVMPEEWRSQLYEAAAKVDNQEIYELLSEIPDEYDSLAKGLADLAEQFRCDKIIDLAKSTD